MGRRGNSFNTSRGPRRRREMPTRVIATAIVEREESILLTQLATGRFAGYWLLPSASVAENTIPDTVRDMVLERTGHEVIDLNLLSVLEEPKTDARALRFVFAATVAELGRAIMDTEIAQARWFTRPAVREVLDERDVVPALGVMALLRAWADGTALPAYQVLRDDAVCPCGSGYLYAGCCGWDMR